jgi:hypothetical protein
MCVRVCVCVCCVVCSVCSFVGSSRPHSLSPDLPELQPADGARGEGEAGGRRRRRGGPDWRTSKPLAAPPQQSHFGVDTAAAHPSQQSRSHDCSTNDFGSSHASNAGGDSIIADSQACSGTILNGARVVRTPVRSVCTMHAFAAASVQLDEPLQGKTARRPDQRVGGVDFSWRTRWSNKRPAQKAKLREHFERRMQPQQCESVRIRIAMRIGCPGGNHSNSSRRPSLPRPHPRWRSCSVLPPLPRCTITEEACSSRCEAS